VAGDELDEDHAGAGHEDPGGGADDATTNEADAPTADLQGRRGHEISIRLVLRIRVMDA
jgi:hypothetical protein